MSAGAMGQAFALQFKAQGFEVLSALENRSARTRKLAQTAGIRDVGNLTQLTRECDVMLSLMDPGAALAFARELAAVIAHSPRRPLFVECNAIAPKTVHAICEVIEAAGAHCLDAAVMGQAPTSTAKSRLFVSGPRAQQMLPLATPQLSVHVVSNRVGDASAVKMLDAVMSKGITALMLQVLVAARRLGVAETFDRQCDGPRRVFYDWILDTLPIMPPKSYRWVPEVDEIARTLESVGLSGDMMRASAGIYAAVAKTPLGQETPEQRIAHNRSGAEVARLLAEMLQG